MQKAQKKKEETEQRRKSGTYSIIYKEELFVYDCDSVSFQVCLMTVERGLYNQKVTLEFFK